MRFWVFLVAALAAAPAWAQTEQLPPSPTLTQLYACGQIQTDAERLACYDAAVGRLQQAERSGEMIVVDRVQAQEIQRDSFGFNLPSITRLLPSLRIEGQPDQEDEVQVEIDRTGSRGYQRYAFYTSNGQVWTSAEALSDRDHRRLGRPGTVVTIRRASLGSFLMTTGSGAAHRVRREE